MRGGHRQDTESRFGGLGQVSWTETQWGVGAGLRKRAAERSVHPGPRNTRRGEELIQYIGVVSQLCSPEDREESAEGFAPGDNVTQFGL